MAIYDINGTSLSTCYDVSGTSLSYAYDVDGATVFSGSSDYSEYDSDYQYAILQARDAWTAQYRADDTVIPLVLHTDQHGRFSTSNSGTVGLFTYLGLAVNWDEVSAMVGLGDVDLDQANYSQMDTILNYAVDKTKRIDIWGNHDLWQNYSTDSDGNYVVDFDTTYEYFNNETYGDISVAYNHKGIEYHIDEAHNIKYVVVAGWEIDSDLGGYSHYVIGSDSMESIIDMLEVVDGYDIVLLTHCCPFNSIGNKYALSDEGTNASDTIYTDGATSTTDTLNQSLVNPSETTLDEMLLARMNHSSGTISDSYGNSHSYDFTNTTGTIICSLMGHWHRDAYEYSSNTGVCCVDFDAYAYNTHPFYFVNIDRTNMVLYGWKVTDDAVVQSYSIPLSE